MRRHQPVRRFRVTRPAVRDLQFEYLETRRLLAAAANLVPKAYPDDATTYANTPVAIDVVRNDVDVDGTIDVGTVAVASQPKVGTLDLRPDGTIRYIPPSNRFGIDSFSYTVRDDLGAESNAGKVTVAIRSVWQNPENPLDVNGDGGFSPIDILRVVNELNRYGSRLLEHPPQPPLTPPPFVDITGDGYLSPADAMLAINCLNAQSHDGSVAYCPISPLPNFSQADADPSQSEPGEHSVDPTIDSEGPAVPENPSEDESIPDELPPGGPPANPSKPGPATPDEDGLSIEDINALVAAWLDGEWPAEGEDTGDTGQRIDELFATGNDPLDPLLPDGIERLGLI